LSDEPSFARNADDMMAVTTTRETTRWLAYDIYRGTGQQQVQSAVLVHT